MLNRRFCVRLPKGPSRALVLVTLALAALTCRDSTTFHLLSYGTTSVTSDAPVAAADFAELTDYDLASHVTLRQQGLHVTDLTSARPYSVALTVTGPATGQDLQFLGKVDLVASAPNLPDVVVAHGQDFAAGTNAAGLEVDDVELRAYVRTRQLSLHLRATDGTPPPGTIAFGVDFVWDVVVGQPEGACN